MTSRHPHFDQHWLRGTGGFKREAQAAVGDSATGVDLRCGRMGSRHRAGFGGMAWAEATSYGVEVTDGEPGVVAS